MHIKNASIKFLAPCVITLSMYAQQGYAFGCVSLRIMCIFGKKIDLFSPLLIAECVILLDCGI